MHDPMNSGRNRYRVRVIGTLSVAALLVGAATAASVYAIDRFERETYTLVPAGAEVGENAISKQSIYLRSGRIDTKAMSMNQIARFAGKHSSTGRFVLQFDGPLTKAQRVALDEAGVSLDDYLPANAYIAKLDNAATDRLGALNFVRWAGEFDTEWKVDPTIGARSYTTPERIEMNNAGRVAVTVTLFKGEAVKSLKDALDQLPGAELYYNEDLGGNQVASISLRSEDVRVIAGLPAVQFVEDSPELTYRNATTRWIIQSNSNGFTPVYNNGIRGEGQIVGVLDGRPDRNHCSLSAAGKILNYNSSFGADAHGTHVAGTAVGDAGTTGDTRGIAYNASLVCNTIPSFSEAGIVQRLNLHHGQGARMHTNSWGNDGSTAYDSLCRGFDLFHYNNEDSLAFLAVTNGSNLRNPENAKNLLACGASQDTPNQGNFCSGGQGPTSDGRRKPEVYAPGCNTTSARSSTACSTISYTGTSMATPAIAGAGALVRQYFVEGFYPTGSANPSDGFTPSGALVKASLINSSVDMTGVAGYPSNREGWGRVLINNALHFDGDARKLIVDDIRNANGLSTNDEIEIPIEVYSGGQQLRATLVWVDPAASAGASFAAINDLDLEVVSPGGALYRGNVFSGGASTTGGTKDDRNNVEQVHVNNPASGEWIVRIKAAAVNVGTQG